MPRLTVVEAIERRRATRSFRPDPIPAATLAEILRLGLRAPSGYNLQPWRFIAVQSPEGKAKLQACAFGQRQIAEAPVTLICCGDRRVNTPDYIEAVIQLGIAQGGVTDPLANFMRGAIPQVFEKHPSFDAIEAWTNRQTMLAVAHLMIAAQAFGVDSCPMEGFVTEQVKTAFGIPEAVDVCCLLALGYAKEPLKSYGGRWATEKVVYNEQFEPHF